MLQFLLFPYPFEKRKGNIVIMKKNAGSNFGQNTQKGVGTINDLPSPQNMSRLTSFGSYSRNWDLREIFFLLRKGVNVKLTVFSKFSLLSTHE